MPECHHKNGAFSGCTGYADCTAALVQNLFAQCKSQPAPLAFSGRISLIELVKDMAHGFFGHADAVIADNPLDQVMILIQPNGNFALLLGKFDGISNEIYPHLKQQCLLSGVGDFL